VALEAELKRIKEAIAGKPFALIFDETSFDGEAICLVVRFWCGWEMRHECVFLQLVAVSTNGVELAQVLAKANLTRLTTDPTEVKACCRDMCKKNGVTLRALKNTFPDLVEMISPD
jgi:hypothetical protein